MAASDVVQVSVSVSKASLTIPGFGTPLVIATAADIPAGFNNRVRAYTSPDGASADFPPTTTATGAMIAKIFAQDPTVTTVKVGRSAFNAIQQWDIVPTAENSTVYQIVLDGVVYSFTSSGAATVANIITGLVAAIGSPAGLTVTNNGPGTSVRVVAVAGAFHTADVNDITLLQITQDHADPGLGTDLAAIQLEDTDWYGVLYPFPSKACITAIDTFAEANMKLQIAATQDSACATVAKSSDTGGGESIAAALLGAARRTALYYHRLNGEFMDAAVAGARLWTTPGSETWAFAPLEGVTVQGLTATQRANLVAKFVNFYETSAGANMTSNNGVVSFNEYIDVIRFEDWVQVNVQIQVLAVMVAAGSAGGKVPMTDPGIGAVKQAIAGVLHQGVDNGGIIDGSISVTAPLRKNISPTDRAARRLNNVKASADLAGAIQDVSIAITLVE
jgi:hypothetical protein